MGQYTEGQRLMGSDGKIYVVRNGVPVTAQAPMIASPTLPGQIQAQQDTHTRTQQEIKQAEATAAANTTKAKNEATKSGIDTKAAQVDLNLKTGTPPGDLSKTGQAYIDSLPPGVGDLAKEMLAGKYKSAITTSRNPVVMQAALAAAHATNGNFEAAKYDERLAYIKSITDPNSQLGALNTALAHAGLAYDQAHNVAGTNALGDNPLSMGLNAINNWWHSGSPGVNAYNSTLQKYVPEAAKAYSIGTGGERTDMQSPYNINLPLNAKLGDFANDVDLFSGKINSMAHQFDMLGGNSPLNFFSPDALAAIKKINPTEYRRLVAMGVAGGAQGNNPAPPPPSAPPQIGGGAPPPAGPGGAPQADYSSLTGQNGGAGSTVAVTDPNSNLGAFQQTYRNVFDPVMANTFSAFIKKGVPYQTAAAFAQSHGFNPPNPSDYQAAIDFAKAHNGATNVSSNRSVPTTLGERLASSPAASFTAGAAAGATAGLSDVAGRTLVGQQWDANRQALAATNPGADVAGNVVGGVGGMFGAGAAADALGIAAKARQALGAARAARLGQFAPMATDAAYGATYGASENPNDPISGAITGLATAVPGGIAARSMVRATGRAIAPTGGNLAPIYQANPDFRPSIGQVLGSSDNRFVRGAGNLLEPPIPIVSGIQNDARQAGVDQMQRGAYNTALADLAPFNSVLGRNVSQLPEGVVKGAPANDFLQTAMGEAQQHARSGMQFTPDPQFQQELGAWQRNPDAISLTKDQTQHVQSTIAQAMNGRINPDGTMAGPNYAAATSDLARVARNWSSNPATASQASYLRDYIDIMDGAASRSSPPEASALLNAANNGYAKSVILENAAKAAGGDSTEFTGKQLLKSVQNSDPSVRDRAFLRGQALMQDYATAASKLKPPSPDSLLSNLGGLGEVGAVGYLAPHMATLPWIADTIANLPGVRNVVGAAMAPRSATLPASLADTTNLVGQGLYKRANTLGMFGAPLALSYFGGQ